VTKSFNRITDTLKNYDPRRHLHNFRFLTKESGFQVYYRCHKIDSICSLPLSSFTPRVLRCLHLSYLHSGTQKSVKKRPNERAPLHSIPCSTAQSGDVNADLQKLQMAQTRRLSKHALLHCISLHTVKTIALHVACELSLTKRVLKESGSAESKVVTIPSRCKTCYGEATLTSIFILHVSATLCLHYTGH
jgi:hypothetical protein